jgi:hypothetical protein
MAYGADIIDDYKWRHPKWEDAIKREDAQMWLEANEREGKKLHAHHCIPYLDEYAKDGGRSLVPLGEKLIRCMRICWIKSSGEYKLRIIYFGNQEKYDGETFAPTGSKEIVLAYDSYGIVIKLGCVFA